MKKTTTTTETNIKIIEKRYRLNRRQMLPASLFFAVDACRRAALLHFFASKDKLRSQIWWVSCERLGTKPFARRCGATRKRQCERVQNSSHKINHKIYVCDGQANGCHYACGENWPDSMMCACSSACAEVR